MDNYLNDTQIFQNWLDAIGNLTENDVTGNLTEVTTELPGNNTQQTSGAVCVLCQYKLQTWLKVLRVGFGGVIVVANMMVFVCLVMARSLPMSLRYFLLNVSVVDFFYGLGFLYHSAIVDFPAFIKMNLECRLRYGMLCMVSMVAMFTLTAMCVERVIALRFTFSYPRLVTKRNIVVAIFVFWLVPTGLVIPAYVFMDGKIGECNFIRFIATRSFLVFAIVYLIFMVVAVICQLILFFIAQSQIKKILATMVGGEKDKAAFNMNVKATSTTLAMAVPFVVCASPKVFTYIYLASMPNERLQVQSLTLLAVTIYLNISNSLANPFIYWWRLPQVRAPLLKLCGFKSSLDSSSGSGKEIQFTKSHHAHAPRVSTISQKRSNDNQSVTPEI